MSTYNVLYCIVYIVNITVTLTEKATDVRIQRFPIRLALLPVIGVTLDSIFGNK